MSTQDLEHIWQSEDIWYLQQLLAAASHLFILYERINFAFSNTLPKKNKQKKSLIPKLFS